MRYSCILIVLFYALPFFAQEIVSEAITINNGAISLPGTLSYPRVKERLPLVIFIHGSGNIDRNGNQAGLNIKANYIKMLSDSLNGRGIAFFRYDKRTSNPENNKNMLKTIVYEDLADDAKQVIRYFKDDKRFRKIIL
ncbi:MAG: alpha/beta hydrolase, partial [Sinomicrobium sp.]|nr:alpha/beta hydrolase [Sinomicrobium sp.]